MSDIVSRPYEAGDFPACLALFDSNVPGFFASGERDEFCQFLGSVNAGGYLVLVRNASVIACGGLVVAEGQAGLAWGMVDRALHGQGLGTRLMQARLALAQADPGIVDVTLATSQHTRGFYESFGFIVTGITPDGFARGLDRWDMTLRLRSSAR